MLPASASIDWNPIDLRRKPPLHTKWPNDCIACLSWTVIYTAVYSNCMSLGIPYHCVCTHSIANGSSHQIVNVSLRTHENRIRKRGRPTNWTTVKSRNLGRNAQDTTSNIETKIGTIVSKSGKPTATESSWMETIFDWTACVWWTNSSFQKNNPTWPVRAA